MTKEQREAVLAWTPLALSAVGVVFAGLAWWAVRDEADATRKGVEAALVKDTDERTKAREETWQATVVYKIIESGSKTDVRGIALNDILLNYRTEGIVAEGINLKKESLQEPELRRILLSLLSTKVIQQTIEDRYVTSRAQGLAEQYAEGIILCRLSSGTVFNIETLRRSVTSDGSMSDAYFDIVINVLISEHKVTQDANGKLSPIAKSPCEAGGDGGSVIIKDGKGHEEEIHKPGDKKPEEPIKPIKPPPC